MANPQQSGNQQAAERLAAEKQAAEKLEALAKTEHSNETLNKLAAAEEQIRQLKEQLEAKDTAALGGLKINPQASAECGDTGGWKFRVGPLAPKYAELLPIKEIMACDESEAKRWYCASHDFPVGSRRAIDPVAIEIRVECVDPRRQQLIHRKARLGTIRAKLNAGQQLTEEENQILQNNESEVMGSR